MRQNVFVDEIVHEAITRMMESKTPFYSTDGSDDSVELMEKLAAVDTNILMKYKEQLIDIFTNIEKNN